MKTFVSAAMIFSLYKSLRSKKDFGLPSFHGIIEVKSVLQGRIRLILPSLKGDDLGCQNLSERFMTLDAITSIETSPITGSVLICYDSDSVDTETLMGAIIQVEGLEEDIEKLKEPSLNRVMAEAKDKLNNLVYEGANGSFNADSLVTLALLYFAIRLGMRGITRNAPNPLVVAMWCYQSISSGKGKGQNE